MLAATVQHDNAKPSAKKLLQRGLDACLRLLRVASVPPRAPAAPLPELPPAPTSAQRATGHAIVPALRPVAIRCLRKGRPHDLVLGPSGRAGAPRHPAPSKRAHSWRCPARPRRGDPWPRPGMPSRAAAGSKPGDRNLVEPIKFCCGNGVQSCRNFAPGTALRKNFRNFRNFRAFLHFLRSLQSPSTFAAELRRGIPGLRTSVLYSHLP